MKINHKRQANIEIFELDGELTFQTSPELRKRLQDTLQKQVQGIVVSLRKVSYIDSSGLATFVEALQKMKKYNGRLVLCELAPAVRSVFEIAKLDGVFSLVPSETDAYGLLNP